MSAVAQRRAPGVCRCGLGGKKIIVVTKKSARAGASKRLATYRAKRDFSVTAEPSGRSHLHTPATGSSSSATARRLHYDFRLEVGGVVSWAVPKGPTLDPDVKRLAVHVEDHPLELLRLRGRHPRRRVRRRRRHRLGLGHVGAGQGRRPARRRSRPATSTSTSHGEKLAVASCSCARGRDGRRSSGCCSTSTTTHAVAGWDRRGPPALGEERAHQRRGEGGAAGRPGRAAPAGPAPTADELAALDALGKAGEWTLGEHDAASSPTSTRCCSRPAARGAGADQAGPHPPPRHHGAGDAARTCTTGRSTCTASPTASTRRASGRRRSRRTRPTGSPRWHYDDADPGETEQYVVLDSPARPGVGRQLRRRRAPPVDVDGGRRRTSRRGR